MKILVRSPNWIGDQVLAFPFFHYLRKAHPKARITVACVDWVSDVQFRGLVDEVVKLPRVHRPGLKEKWRALEEGAALVRASGPFDLGIALPNSISSAWLLKRAGVERRRGYKAEGRGILLNDGIRWDDSPSRHRAQAYLDLLPTDAQPARSALEFWGTHPVNELDEPVPGELPRFDFSREWKSPEIVEPPAEPYWVLAVGATADSRRWPLNYFATLAKRVASETGWRGLIVGGPKEAPLAQQLTQDSTLKLRDFTARGPVPVLSKVFAGAKFSVTNESGLAHVAALCGSFVQIVCGAADPRRTQPIGPGKVQVAINPIECWPCERNVCPLALEKKNACLLGISPDVVWEEIKRGIRLNPTD